MKILLVYPRYLDTFWSFRHALKLISKKANFPPLGLLTVAESYDKTLLALRRQSQGLLSAVRIRD